MRTRSIETVLWVLAFGVGVVGGLRTNIGGPNGPLRLPAVPPVKPAPTRPDIEVLVRAEHNIVESNPFRFTRRPSALPFGNDSSPIPDVVPAVPPKPGIRLRGIVGPPWEAVIEGLPDRSGGVVVRSGDRIGELSIVRITRDTIRISGMDTVWTLTLERPWQ